MVPSNAERKVEAPTYPEYQYWKNQKEAPQRKINDLQLKCQSQIQRLP